MSISQPTRLSICSIRSWFLLTVLPSVHSLQIRAELDHQVLAIQAHARTDDTLTVLAFETNALNTTPLGDFFKVQLQAMSGAPESSNVIGANIKFEGFSSKYVGMLTKLRNISPETLVVMTDYEDVLLNAQSNMSSEQWKAWALNFKEQFEALVEGRSPGAIVMSAEAQCCVGALTHVRPGDYFAKDGCRLARACSSGADNCLAIQGGSTPWEDFLKKLAKTHGTTSQHIYPNAGLISGRAADLIRILEALQLDRYEDDQAVWTDFIFRFNHTVVLDYEQFLFGNSRHQLVRDAGDVWDIDSWNLDKRWMSGCVFELDEELSMFKQVETHTYPRFLHSPGKYYHCLTSLAHALGWQGDDVSGKHRLAEAKAMGFHDPNEIPKFVEEITCEVKPEVHWTPFVMLIHEATGSSWATGLLQSHSRIVAGGELYNNIKDEQDAANQCSFWNADLLSTCENQQKGCDDRAYFMKKNLSRVKAVGFKQKYLYCMGNAETLKAAEECATRRWDPFGVRTGKPFQDVTFFLESKMIDIVKPKIICQSRRNAYDAAMSKYFEIGLIEACGIAANNYVLDSTSNDHSKINKCMDRKMRRQWVVDLNNFTSLLVQAEKQYNQATLMCDAYKQLGFETYKLEYEDMVEDTDKSYRNLQSFLFDGDQDYEKVRKGLVKKRSPRKLREVVANFNDLSKHVKTVDGGRFGNYFHDDDDQRSHRSRPRSLRRASTRLRQRRRDLSQAEGPL